jgi:pSer/pThr/pTyr-binding forkhead associated (FHA) protein
MESCHCGKEQTTVNETFITLIQRNTDQENQIWTLPSPILIGRGRHNTIVLDDTKLSRQHLRIHQQGNAIVVEDLQSKNGMLVNDNKVAMGQLQDGDTVQIGAFVFQFSSELLASNVSLVRCPNCRKVHRRAHLDCEWCGFSLANAATLPTVLTHRNRGN